MSDIVEKLRLKEAAEEDIYFAERDLELIEALRKQKLAKLAKCGGTEKAQVKDFEKRFKSIARKNKQKPLRMLRALRTLLDEIKAACVRR